MSTLPAVRDNGEIAQRPASLLESVMRAVANPDLDPARLREFLEIGRQLEADDAKKQFNSAMAEMKPKLPAIRKDGQIIYKAGAKPTTFAKWDDIHRACMPVLSEHGFTCSFSSELQGSNALLVKMTVRHTGGHEDPATLPVPWLDSGGAKSPAQQAASSFTLAQRQVFIKYFNILTEDSDDDGSGRGVPDRVTHDQISRIEDIIQACSDRDPKFPSAFQRWIKAEFGVDKHGDLFQGDQLAAVMSKLSEKMKGLGIA